MKTRIAAIGFGERGMGMIDILLEMKDVEVVMICDLKEKLLNDAAEKCHKKGQNPIVATNLDDVIANESVEAILFFTPWNSHIPMAIRSMKASKYTAIEVGPANNLDEIYELVRVSEETGIPCMMLENCCYGEDEMFAKNMIQKGLFGEILHCRGGYQHDLRQWMVDGMQNDLERVYHNMHRSGDLYETHELGPIMNWLKINHGNRLLTLTSMGCKSRGLQEYYARNHAEIPFKMADITTTMITCANGETILLTHNISNPRPYSRGGEIHGTKGLWMDDKKSLFFEGMNDDESWESVEKFPQYTHPLWQHKENFTTVAHGGMDYLVLRAFLQAVRNHTAVPFDVYDAATLLAVSVLSEKSVAEGGAVQTIPDFTHGEWIRERPSPKSVYSLDTIHEDLFENGIQDE